MVQAAVPVEGVEARVEGLAEGARAPAEGLEPEAPAREVAVAAAEPVEPAELAARAGPEAPGAPGAEAERAGPEAPEEPEERAVVKVEQEAEVEERAGEATTIIRMGMR